MSKTYDNPDNWEKAHQSRSEPKIVNVAAPTEAIEAGKEALRIARLDVLGLQSELQQLRKDNERLRAYNRDADKQRQADTNTIYRLRQQLRTACDAIWATMVLFRDRGLVLLAAYRGPYARLKAAYDSTGEAGEESKADRIIGGVIYELKRHADKWRHGCNVTREEMLELAKQLEQVAAEREPDDTPGEPGGLPGGEVSQAEHNQAMSLPVTQEQGRNLKPTADTTTEADTLLREIGQALHGYYKRPHDDTYDLLVEQMNRIYDYFERKGE